MTEAAAPATAPVAPPPPVPEPPTPQALQEAEIERLVKVQTEANRRIINLQNKTYADNQALKAKEEKAKKDKIESEHKAAVAAVYADNTAPNGFQCVIMGASFMCFAVFAIVFFLTVVFDGVPNDHNHDATVARHMYAESRMLGLSATTFVLALERVRKFVRVQYLHVSHFAATHEEGFGISLFFGALTFNLIMFALLHYQARLMYPDVPKPVAAVLCQAV